MCSSRRTANLLPPPIGFQAVGHPDNVSALEQGVLGLSVHGTRTHGHHDPAWALARDEGMRRTGNMGRRIIPSEQPSRAPNSPKTSCRHLPQVVGLLSAGLLAKGVGKA